MGAFASRVTVMTGEATRLAAAEGAEPRRSTMAAELLQAPPDELDVGRRRGRARRSRGGPSIALAEVARAPCSGSRSRGEREPGPRGRRLVPHATT